MKVVLVNINFRIISFEINKKKNADRKCCVSFSVLKILTNVNFFQTQYFQNITSLPGSFGSANISEYQQQMFLVIAK